MPATTPRTGHHRRGDMPWTYRHASELQTLLGEQPRQSGTAVIIPAPDQRHRRGGMPWTHRHASELQTLLGEQPRRSGITVIIPARDERNGLRAALESLTAQTLRPDRVIVVINNSGDETEAIARAYAAGPGRRVSVLSMAGHNRFRKAGALNYGITSLLDDTGRLPGSVRLLVNMDGDTVLDRHFLARASRVLTRDARLGGVSAACRAKPVRGATWFSRLLLLFQRIEYGRAAFSRVLTNVHTMAGAGSVYRAAALNEVLGSRRHIFQQRETNLVEDYETTLYLKWLGWRVTANQGCIAWTDVMPTTRMLLAQRDRWVRGTVDEWRNYGWFSKVTRRSSASMILALAVFAYMWTWVAMAAVKLAEHGTLDPRYLILVGSWMAYQALSVRRMGWRIMLFEMSLLPGLAFGLLRNYWIAGAIVRSFAARPARWT